MSDFHFSVGEAPPATVPFPAPTAPSSTSSPAPASSVPWTVDNLHALAVHDRASSDWTCGIASLDNPSGVTGASRIIGRQAGRDWILLYALPTNGSTVYINGHPGPLENTTPVGFPLPPGSSITLPTEGSVYAVIATGSGQVAWAVGLNRTEK